MRGAKANDLGLELVPEEVKESRYRRFMERQQKVSSAILKKKVGQRLPVIIDKVEGLSATGRTKYDAPEIDGSVHVAARRPVRAGDIVTVKIERSDAYDLHGLVV